MGLDIGEKTIGVALSDPLCITAQGLTTIKRTKTWQDIDQVLKIIEDEGVDIVVCGLPKNMNNSLGPSAQRVMSFVDLLKTKTDREVVYEDERLTTKRSEQVLIDSGVRREKRKEVIDKIAATFILQTYLDREVESGYN